MRTRSSTDDLIECDDTASDISSESDYQSTIPNTYDLEGEVESFYKRQKKYITSME